MSSEEQAAYSKQVLEPALATISGRITAYEQRLRDWQDLGSRQESLNLTPDEIKQIVSCRNRVADLQDAYKGLQERLLQEQLPKLSREQLFSSLQDFKEKDIAYLEGDCPKLFNSLSSPAASSKTAQEQVSPSAVSQQESKPQDDGQPVQEEVTSAAQQELSGSSLRKQGIELLKTGHEQEARSIFVNLLTSARRDGDRQLEISALQMLADLDFGHQEYASARRKYVELRQLESSLADRAGKYIAALEAVGTRRDELDAYAALLLGCLTYNPDKAGFTVVQQASEFIHLFPDSPLLTDAEDWSRKIEKEAEEWFSSLISEIDRLLVAQKNDEALKRLEQIPLDILPLDKQDILRQKRAALPLTTESVQATPPAAASAAPVPERNETVQSNPVQQASPLSDPVSVLQETWDKGMAAMQSEDYDQAIELFSKLRGTEFATKAEGKIEEAERLAGENVRKKAAGLFQQALNAADPAAKKELLLSSKSLLENILRKYPRAGIEAKVKKNLSSVDRELAAVSKY
ncbi:hypothetical protein [Candidatus Electronema sp. PJ]|uniref:hypothetical protein n=1 Tax=Candidatus Electronema sp. PJ TaxID=3401572 RepID=UPI003AA9E1D5